MFFAWQLLYLINSRWRFGKCLAMCYVSQLFRCDPHYIVEGVILRLRVIKRTLS